MAAAHRPDVITVDDKLDSGTGVEAIREICRNRSIPVVFLSARPSTIRETIPGAVIVDKPFSHAQLISAIAAASTG